MKNNLRLHENELVALADKYHTEVTLLKALCKVETGGKGGFLENGRPIILFEGHIFWRELKRLGIKPELYTSQYPNIVYPNWDKSQYRGGTSEYLRLTLAISINKTAALRSVSWGMFQVMGFNHTLCNEPTIDGFVAKMNKNEASQLELSLNYITNAGIMPLLNNHMWSDFALLYNGPGYKANRYDEKLRDAYEKLTRK